MAPISPLAARVAELCATAPGTWGVVITEVGETEPLASVNPDLVLRTASSAKLLLLVALAEEVTAGRLDPDEPLRRDTVPPVHDSGLWQHLTQDILPVRDLATLVGSVSDNWATNVLIHRVGLDRIANTASRRGINGVHLHDVVRDVRGDADPPTLSTGHATGYASLMSLLWSGRGDPALGMALDWLRPSVDHSMVAGAFGLDPLAHAAEPITVINKTGTDDGIRADSGVVIGGSGAVAYSCLVNWDDAGPGSRRRVLAAMRHIGEAIAESRGMSY